MESRSDHIPGQAFQIDNSDLLSEKIKLNYESHKNILDLSCKNRTKSPPINVTDLTHSSLASTTRDRHEESNNSDTERHSPYATVLMSPYSDTNSPKKGKLDDSTAVVNNYSNMVVPSAMISPFIYPPPHLLSNSELTNDIPKEMLSMSSSLSTSFVQASQSLPLGEATKIIPQTCSPIKIQSTVMFPQQMEASQVRSARLESLKKVTRPFKAYPNDSVLYFNKDEHERYMMFREHLLQSVKKVNENPNPKMRRTSKSPTLLNSTVEEKDAAYWERRRKNNAAAKRSRDARRAKEDELAIRASYFEAENRILKSEIKYLRYICGLYNIDIDRKQS